MPSDRRASWPYGPSVNTRQAALDLLAAPQGETRFAAAYLPRSIADRCGCRPHEAYEALWGLLAEGLVYLDPAGQPGMDNWRWRLSQDGIAVASSGTWEPRDPEGFLQRLRRHDPPVDPGAFVYLNEALRSFNARCYLSTTVMLGVAVEQVFIGLAEAVVRAEPGRGAPLRNALDSHSSNQRARFTYLRKILEPLRPQLPEGLADQITLDSIADLLRVSRNDAGHPTGTTVDEDTARLHLISAALLMTKMTDLRDYFTMAAAASDA